MEKVLNLFTRIYRPQFDSLTQYLRSNQNPDKYFNDIVTGLQEAEKPDFDAAKARLEIPYIISRRVASEGDFQRSFQYIKKLLEERRIISQLPADWRSSGLGSYSQQTLDRRIQRARARAGRQARAHMIATRAELVDFFEQEGFIRYEMINGKREQLQKKMAGRELPQVQIDEAQSRDFFIQNGYQYWTFRGEYWLDELGNYHYVGTQSCD